MLENLYADVIGLLAARGHKCVEAPGKKLCLRFPDYRGESEWRLCLNGNKESTEQDHVSVPPFAFAVWWNDWLAGIVTMHEATIAAHPEGANAETFLRSLRDHCAEEPVGAKK